MGIVWHILRRLDVSLTTCRDQIPSGHGHQSPAAALAPTEHDGVTARDGRHCVDGSGGDSIMDRSDAVSRPTVFGT
jgi:hypothetical protein